MKKQRKGRIDRSESFDEFLARNGLLAETEGAAIKEIITDQFKMVMAKSAPRPESSKSKKLQQKDKRKTEGQ